MITKIKIFSADKNNAIFCICSKKCKSDPQPLLKRREKGMVYIFVSYKKINSIHVKISHEASVYPKITHLTENSDDTDNDFIPGSIYI